MNGDEKKPLVSIIIPLYNHEMFILQTLDSIMKESYPNKEIVVVDDGSKDKSYTIAKDWIDKNSSKIPGYIYTQENSGIPKTLNRLVDLSNGEYITSMGSDDLLLDGGISKRINYLLRNPKKLGVFGDCVVIDKNENKLYDSSIEDFATGNKSKFINDQDLQIEMISNFSIGGPAWLVNKNIFDIIGRWDENLSIDDCDFYLRACAYKLFGFIDCKVAAYRIHDTNTTKDLSVLKAKKDRENFVKIAKKNINLFDGKPKKILENHYKKMLLLNEKPYCYKRVKRISNILSSFVPVRKIRRRLKKYLLNFILDNFYINNIKN